MLHHDRFQFVKQRCLADNVPAISGNGSLIIAMDNVMQELAVRLDTRHRILQIGLKAI